MCVYKESLNVPVSVEDVVDLVNLGLDVGAVHHDQLNLLHQQHIKSKNKFEN